MIDLIQSFPKPWEKFLDEGTIAELRKLVELLTQARDSITPPQNKIYAALESLSPNEVKVVILGQDPYPGTDVANGFAFATNDSKIPASLKNVFEKIKIETGLPVTSESGRPQELKGWVKQGVLLLNQSLTFCHYADLNRKVAKHWKKVVTQLLVSLVRENPGVALVLWGNKSQKFQAHFDARNCVSAPHPSPLAENRSPFFLTPEPHFKVINERLKSMGRSPIDWTRT